MCSTEKFVFKDPQFHVFLEVVLNDPQFHVFSEVCSTRSTVSCVLRSLFYTIHSFMRSQKFVLHDP
jgi:hypothetical protein